MADRIVPDFVFVDGELLTDRALVIEAGRVAAIEESHEDRTQRGVVAPRFIDVQVNGGGGVLFNTTPTAEGARAIARAHRRFGTGGILPTLISDEPEVIEAGGRAVAEAWGDPSILGLHIEGPHISEVKRGTHKAAVLRPLDAVTLSTVDMLTERGIPVMLTVAPEVVGPEAIRDLVERGAIVSLGHTNADAALCAEAFAAGARSVTHLYNAMSPLTHRAPGLVGAALMSEAYVGIIADLVHVDAMALQIAFQARTAQRKMVLVSDAMPTVGGPQSFDLYGNSIEVREGRLVNAEGALAGAHTTMAEGVANLVRHCGVSLADALHAAISAPADLLGNTDAQAVVGRTLDDLIVIDDELSVSALNKQRG